jgi:pimeloyl-ACP methyl ester carboxylesterase
VPSVQHFVSNDEGYDLALQQTWDPATLRRGARPVLIVPGYGMNSFIFGYHPRGRSFEAALLRSGFEVWRVDLRAQGATRNRGGTDVFGLEHMAGDLAVAIAAALDRTSTGATEVSVIGASLGATVMFAHAALVPDHHVGAFVSMGGPVRWVRVHPLLRIAFVSPTLVGLLPIRGTRTLAKFALPRLLQYTPSLLSMYIHREHLDLEKMEELAKTIEDPSRHVNRQIAEWIGKRDLVLGGVNVTHALPKLTAPLLSVVANADGIVPRETAEYPHENVGSSDRTLVHVGTSDVQLAHADMFVSDRSEDLVYKPVCDWLLER